MSGLSYAGFHVLFTLPPLAYLFVFGTTPTRRVARVGIILMTVVAVIYTTPWDNYLIQRGVWWYGPGDIFARIWKAPVGEYLFFILQPILTGLWVTTLTPDATYRNGDFDRRPRTLGALVWLGFGIIGTVLLTVESGFYLGAILAWACPVVALQWAVGGGYLTRRWREWSLAIAIPTVYLWMIDSIAIALGVWTISDQYSTGINLLGLPIEEAVFFLITNILIVYGLILFEWIIDYWYHHPDAIGPEVSREWL
ncbi:lycopene cyclase domain-containing protein [Haloquadratum walsbyi]|uniref:Lycopene beta-cyclase n=2 Tax=Haloquadratum walsbyi TaxID=293091 RepID=Q18DH4_HALWD|nr:lycopene cyclase domain-containing protein [Haloquadratum walsbyi]CAJ51148.1 lycopene beta-cyclase [Haloquadratum walsbyi DSM 16790]CCC39002.1 lycopene beta-cyclase [Haloquadratum walsbyi C23]